MTDWGLTNEEHAARKNRLTGSTLAAYLGYNPWQSPLEAWEVNAGLRVVEGNENMDAGNIMEASIKTLVLHTLGFSEQDAMETSTVFHAKHPEMAAVHPDLLLPKEYTGIQIKNHNPHYMKKYKGKPGSTGPWDNNLVPEMYLIQCMWELEVIESAMGGEWTWILAAYFGGSNLRLYWIKSDPKLRRALVEAGTAFWREHLDPDGPRSQPDNRYWKAGKPEAPAAPKPKMSMAELQAAPIPFGGESFTPPIPFLED